VVGVSQVFATQRTEERIGGRLLSSEVSIAGPLESLMGVLTADEIEQISAAVALCVGAS
jgi:hypothetical protein